MQLDEHQYQMIVESSPNMIWRAGLDAKCNYFNATWLKFTGRTISEEVGDGWTEGIHPDDFDFCLNIYLSSFARQERFEMEYRLKRYDGVFRWINDQGVPFYYPDGSFAGYIGSCMDVTDKVEAVKLKEMAEHDGLTNLYNRSYSSYLLEYEFRRARQEHSDLSLMMIDVDHFKHFNDTFGHSFGDMVLKMVAKKIQEHLRKEDMPIRFGGDEFLLLLPGTSIPQATAIGERLLSSMQNIPIDADRLFSISLSIGVALVREDAEIQAMIELADETMYAAKQKGGHQIVVAE